MKKEEYSDWRTLAPADSARIKCQCHYRAHDVPCENNATQCNTWKTGAMSAPAFLYVCDEGAKTYKDNAP